MIFTFSVIADSMRALRNCDFCADDAVGAFEIVPPELEPTEAEQRRVVCCSDCSEASRDAARTAARSRRGRDSCRDR